MSRDKKRQMIWYQVDDGEAVTRHLEKMARIGWLLEGVDNWYYVYRRSEPAEVKYAATFFPDASVFDPDLPEGQRTYVEYCEAAGWELAASYGPVQYFRSALPDPPPIETDEAMKLSAIRRSMRKTFVFSYAILLLLPAMNLPLAWSRFQNDPMAFCSSYLQLSLLLIMAGILLFSGGMLLDYLIWVLRSKYSVNRGGACCKPHTRFRLILTSSIIIICAVTMLGYLMDAAGTLILIYLPLYGGVIILGRWVLRQLKENSTERGTVRVLYFVFALVGGLAAGIGAPFLTVKLVDAGVIHLGRKPAETYTYTMGPVTRKRNIFLDPLPVRLEDLGYTVTEEDHCSYKAETDRTFIAVHSEYTQEAVNISSELPRLYYQTYRTEWPWLMEQCWEDLIEEQRRWPLLELDPGPWDALEVYCPEGMGFYLLRYPECIITFRLVDGDVTPEQLAGIVQTLRP